MLTLHFYLCIAIGHGVELEGDGFFIPVLHDFTEDLGQAPMDVGDGDVLALLLGFGEEDIDHGGFRIVLGDDEGVRKDSCAATVQ